MCQTEETKIGGICSCLCTDLMSGERVLIARCLESFRAENETFRLWRLTGREIFVLCEFFARRGFELWNWGSKRDRPDRNNECILARDCLNRYADVFDFPLVEKWLRIYMHEFFEPRESLPEIGETFVLEWKSLRSLLDFFLHHGGCLTNKFIFQC